MQNNKGFTLVEMLVTLTIAAILASVAVPATRELQARMRVDSAANDLVASLKDARSESITARRHTIVSSIANSTTNWSPTGWRVTELKNGATATIAERAGLPSSITVKVLPALSSFRFEASTGAAQLIDATVFAGAGITFRICDTKSIQERGRDVSVNKLGRIFIQTHATSATCNL